VLGRKVLEGEGLAGAHADPDQLRADGLFLRPAGANCSAKSRYSKKLVFTISALTAGKSTPGAAGAGGCFRYAESGCSL
jgi:hypothetical protein